MAVLSDAERFDIWREVMADLSYDREEVGTLTKAQFRAAVDAADAWADANAASFNTALPLPSRTVLTASQKSRLLSAVILRRYEVS